MSANDVIALRDYRMSERVSDTPSGSEELAAGTHLLNQQYRITGYLNSGGFGITYLSKDSLNRNVVIKECYPAFMCKRVGSQVEVRNKSDQNELDSIVDLFVKEAHSLAALEHDNIVKVHQIFEQNNTAYMALDFVNGYDLVDIRERHADALSPARITTITRRLLPAIAFVHDNNMLHRDVSPDNILIAKNGEPMLIDFGAAHEQVSHATRSYSQLKFVKDGYSPQEFYIPGADQGPWSDLYSFAASIYYTISGQPPIDAQSRLAAVAANRPDPYEPLEKRFDGYPSGFLAAIDKAASLLPEDRFQTATEWLAAISRKSAPRPTRPVTLTKEENGGIQVDSAESANTVPEDAVSPAVAASLKAYADASLSKDKPARQAEEATLDQEPELGLIEPPKRGKPKLIVALATIAVGVMGIAYFQFVAPKDASEITLAAASGVEAVGSTENTGQALSNSAPSVSISSASNAIEQNENVPATQSESAPAAGDMNTENQSDVGRTETQASETSPQLNLKPTSLIPEIALRNFSPTELGGADSDSYTYDWTTLSARSPFIKLPSHELEAELVAQVTPPAPAPLRQQVAFGPLAQSQIASSRWNLALPFEFEMQRVRNATTATITAVAENVDPGTIGEWISVGTTIYTVNGNRLEEGKDLTQQLLGGLVVDPDGYARASVRYRNPADGIIDRGLIAAEVIREVTLADGTLIEGRLAGDKWTYVVKGLGLPAENGLKAGDILIAHQETGIAFDDHTDLARAFERMVELGAPTAILLVRRGSANTSVQLTLSQVVEGAGN